MARVADSVAIDGIAPQCVVDAGDDVLAVFVAPRAPGGPFERFAVAGRAAEIGVEDEVAARGEELLLEVEGVAGRRVRAAVTEDDERIVAAGLVELRWKCQPALDLCSILARPPQALGLTHGLRREERAVHVAQFLLAGAVDVR